MIAEVYSGWSISRGDLKTLMDEIDSILRIDLRLWTAEFGSYLGGVCFGLKSNVRTAIRIETS